VLSEKRGGGLQPDTARFLRFRQPETTSSGKEPWHSQNARRLGYRP
jgi:hypothetical protein